MRGQYGDVLPIDDAVLVRVAGKDVEAELKITARRAVPRREFADAVVPFAVQRDRWCRFVRDGILARCRQVQGYTVQTERLIDCPRGHVATGGGHLVREIAEPILDAVGAGNRQAPLRHHRGLVEIDFNLIDRGPREWTELVVAAGDQVAGACTASRNQGADAITFARGLQGGVEAGGPTRARDAHLAHSQRRRRRQQLRLEFYVR